MSQLSLLPGMCLLSAYLIVLPMKSDWSFKVQLNCYPPLWSLSWSFKSDSKIQKIFYLRISWFSSQKSRMCTYRRAKLPLCLSWVVLKPIWDNDDENSYHLLNTWYELGIMLNTVHTSFIHLFNYYLLSISWIPCTKLGAGGAIVNETDKRVTNLIFSLLTTLQGRKQKSKNRA